MHNRPLTPEQIAGLVAALQVLVLDARIGRHLEATDPQALQQARLALDAAGAPSTVEAITARQYDAVMATRAGRLPDGAPITFVPACGQPIDALIPGACERPSGHAGPCRAYSLEARPLESSPDAAGEWAIDAAMAEAAGPDCPEATRHSDVPRKAIAPDRVWLDYAAVEIATVGRDTEQPVATGDDRDAVEWMTNANAEGYAFHAHSVYLRLKIGGVECLCDCWNRDAAQQLGTALARQLGVPVWDYSIEMPEECEHGYAPGTCRACDPDGN